MPYKEQDFNRALGGAFRRRKGRHFDRDSGGTIRVVSTHETAAGGRIKWKIEVFPRS